MDMTSLMPLLLGVGLVVLLVVGLLALFKAFYIKVPQGTALIVNDMSSTPKVHFTGALVYPVIHLKEFMRISLITLEVDRRGKDGLICRDNMRADITVAFYLRVNETQDDVLKVAKAIGVDRASDRSAVNELFNAKFSEALKTVGKQFDFVQLFENRQDFRDRIIEVIGNDLNGYVLEDVAIDYLEQTAKNSLDPSNILDAEGIRKITELTATQNVITNELERNEELAIKKKNVETREAALALERQQADAEARQKREIETIRAREEAETARVKEEERLKAEQARIQAQQEIDVRTENHQREVEVAQQNRQRAVVIEVEKVTRAKDLEIVAREREVELQKIEKEKALEEQRKNIANVIRERVAVEKTVAQEEERIKEVREVSEAERVKQVILLQAQAEAEQELVRQVKQAEADEARSSTRRWKSTPWRRPSWKRRRSRPRRRSVWPRASRPSAQRRAWPMRGCWKSPLRLRKGWLGSGAGTCRTTDRRSQGRRGARPGRRPGARGAGRCQEKDGLAEAKVLAEKLGAQARGEEQLGAAKAKATRTRAARKREVLLQRLNAEAEGLGKKFGALDALSDSARQHEEFRMQLEKSFEEAMAAIAANKDIAKDQAEVLATALGKANIEIVGGEGDFFNSFAKSLSVGKAIEGVVGKSPVVQDVLARLLNGRGAAAAVVPERKSGHENEPAAEV